MVLLAPGLSVIVAAIAFNFCPVTAVMIVFLAVLNDACYDLAENPFEYRARNYALRLLVVCPGERVLGLGPGTALAALATSNIALTATTGDRLARGVATVRSG